MLLAVDTSTAQLGLAIYTGTQVTGEMIWSGTTRHTQELAPAVTSLLSRCGKTMGDVKALAVALGPGSFTSLRVGLAFVKGLALARAIPLVGVPTLDILAAGLPVTNRRLAAVLQAGRGRLALVWYAPGEDGWKSEGPAVVTTAEELEQKIHSHVVVCGEMTAEQRHILARKFKNVLLASPAQCVRRPGMLAEIAWQRWQAGKVDPPAGLAPIYLHIAGGLPA